VPDTSYDLDGDGVVSGNEMVIAKLFDKGHKGKLTPNEREEAIVAIKNVRKSSNSLRESRKSSNGILRSQGQTDNSGSFRRY
jgi:hypothetical protein